MNFKRHEVQEYFEQIVGCLDIQNWKNYKTTLTRISIDLEKKSNLDNCIESDIYSYFHKSLYSFVQALSNIHRNNYSWSIVQLYYSCFYAIRADILLSNHCIIRCSGLYLIENDIGEKFNIFTINKVRGDHQLSIALLKKMHSEYKLTDEILDNELEGCDAYTWMMKHRERSNYQLKNFTDPEIDELFIHTSSYFKRKEISDLIAFYNNSDYTICFDLDHSVLSIPFKKIMQIKNKIKDKYPVNTKENTQHYIYIRKKLMEMGMTKSNFEKLILA